MNCASAMIARGTRTSPASEENQSEVKSPVMPFALPGPRRWADPRAQNQQHWRHSSIREMQGSDGNDAYLNRRAPPSGNTCAPSRETSRHELDGDVPMPSAAYTEVPANPQRCEARHAAGRQSETSWSVPSALSDSRPLHVDAKSLHTTNRTLETFRYASNKVNADAPAVAQTNAADSSMVRPSQAGMAGQLIDRVGLQVTSRTAHESDSARAVPIRQPLASVADRTSSHEGDARLVPTSILSDRFRGLFGFPLFNKLQSFA